MLVGGCAAEPAGHADQRTGGPADTGDDGAAPARSPRLDRDDPVVRDAPPPTTVDRVAPRPEFVCPTGAFCDDFASSELSIARWTDAVAEDGHLGRSALSASRGAGSLVATTKAPSGRAFLVVERGHVGGTWAGVVSFALRPTQVPSASIRGPELLVKTARDGLASLAVVVRPDGLFLDQRASGECPRDWCRAKTTWLGPTTTTRWTRIELGVEAGASAVSPHGRLEASVDGGDLLTTDLTIPLRGGTLLLRAGITAGDTREGELAVDDVVVQVK